MKDGDKNNDGRIDFDGEGLGSARSGRPNQAGESERGAHAGVPSLEGGAGRGQAPPHPLRAGRGTSGRFCAIYLQMTRHPLCEAGAWPDLPRP